MKKSKTSATAPVADATEWLRTHLTAEPSGRARSEVLTAGTAAGFTVEAVRRAFRRLKARAVRGARRTTTWTLRAARTKRAS